MARITFLPAEVVAEYRDGESIFDAGQRAGIKIETACVGKGNCGLCRVRVRQGEQMLNEYTDEEQKHLGNVYFLTKVRLSCRTKLAEGSSADGDVVVELVAKRPRRKK